jgi:hypothetical protein
MLNDNVRIIEAQLEFTFHTGSRVIIYIYSIYTCCLRKLRSTHGENTEQAVYVARFPLLGAHVARVPAISFKVNNY